MASFISAGRKSVRNVGSRSCTVINSRFFALWLVLPDINPWCVFGGAPIGMSTRKLVVKLPANAVNPLQLLHGRYIYKPIIGPYLPTPS